MARLEVEEVNSAASRLILGKQTRLTFKLTIRITTYSMNVKVNFDLYIKYIFMNSIRGL